MAFLAAVRPGNAVNAEAVDGKRISEVAVQAHQRTMSYIEQVVAEYMEEMGSYNRLLWQHLLLAGHIFAKFVPYLMMEK